MRSMCFRNIRHITHERTENIEARAKLGFGWEVLKYGMGCLPRFVAYVRDSLGLVRGVDRKPDSQLFQGLRMIRG